MKNMFFNSVLVAFVLLVASCSKQPEAKVDVMSFNIRLDHVADSLNNWKYRKDAAAQMIAYYTPGISFSEVAPIPISLVTKMKVGILRCANRVEFFGSCQGTICICIYIKEEVGTP